MNKFLFWWFSGQISPKFLVKTTRLVTDVAEIHFWSFQKFKFIDFFPLAKETSWNFPYFLPYQSNNFLLKLYLKCESHHPIFYFLFCDFQTKKNSSTIQKGINFNFLCIFFNYSYNRTTRLWKIIFWKTDIKLMN